MTYVFSSRLDGEKDRGNEDEDVASRESNFGGERRLTGSSPLGDGMNSTAAREGLAPQCPGLFPPD